MTFRLHAPHARKVALASDLYGWDRPKAMQRKGDDWILEADLPSDVRIEYQFVVDGRWIADPVNTTRASNGVGGQNSILIGPEYRYDVPEAIPEVPMRRIAMRVSGSAPTRTIVTFLPEQHQGDLPVLIYGDGPDYGRFVKPQDIAQNLIDAGKIRPCAICLVPSKDRIKEYWKESANYERFIVEDVLATLRRRCPISKDPNDVFVGGASLGGLISLRIAENHPRIVAGGVHSQSGAFWASPASLAKTALRKISPKMRLYIEWGTFEGVLTVSNQRLVRALDELGRPYGKQVTSEGHNWTAWRGRFANGLDYLLGRSGEGK